MRYVNLSRGYSNGVFPHAFSAHAALSHAAPNNVSGSHIVSLIRAIPRHNIENSSVLCAVVAHSRPRGCDATRFQVFVKRANSRFLALSSSLSGSLKCAHLCIRVFAHTYTYVYIHTLYRILQIRDLVGYPSNIGQKWNSWR